jgi:hypothetical protein
MTSILRSLPSFCAALSMVDEELGIHTATSAVGGAAREAELASGFEAPAP